MWYEDLTECDYFSKQLPVASIAVGWLEKGKLYTKGKIHNEIVERTREFNKT